MYNFLFLFAQQKDQVSDKKEAEENNLAFNKIWLQSKEDFYKMLDRNQDYKEVIFK